MKYADLFVKFSGRHGRSIGACGAAEHPKPGDLEQLRPPGGLPDISLGKALYVGQQAVEDVSPPRLRVGAEDKPAEQGGVQEQGRSERGGVRAVQSVQAVSQWNQEQEIVSGDFVTPYPGAYILLIFLPEQQSIRVGSLGEINFLLGWYAYVGSAMGD